MANEERCGDCNLIKVLVSVRMEGKAERIRQN